jgi:beta-glucosidase
MPGLRVQPHVRLGVAGPDDELERAVAMAADSDIAVVLAGRISGEAMDVDSLRLPGRQEEVVAAVAAANPRTVLVTLSANPVILPTAELAAVLHAWFPGEEFPEALADVLTGAGAGRTAADHLPARRESHADSGPCPVSGSRRRRHLLRGAAGRVPLVRRAWRGPCLPFGHGLGYTTFELDGLAVEAAGDGCQVRFAVRNTGSRAGKAVPQIYVRYPLDVGEPGAQLKGFAAVRLPSGERREVTIDVSSDDLMIFDEQSGSSILPAGEYEFRAGFSSRDIRATAVASPPK